MYKRNFVYMCSDFETTTTGKADQSRTDVWSACSIDLSAPDDPGAAVIQGSIEDYFTYLETRAKRESLCVYFHNLKFDGSFILDYLERHPFYKAALDENGGLKKKLSYYGGNYEYIYNISDRGLWYTIDIKIHGNIIQFRDSLKLLPFSLEALGEAFNTKHRKLKMQYTGERYPNCPISNEEKNYIKNDVLVLKEALNIMRGQGHDKLTIGACCLNEFKRLFDKEDYKNFFPDLTEFVFSKEEAALYDAQTADEYIRRSYHGGWCYLMPEKAGVEFDHGITCDVNSLYPSMMHSDSGNRYPVGSPKFFKGKIPDIVKNSDRYYYFVRFKCQFDLKPRKLPTVQIKNSPLYNAREWLKTSNIKDSQGRLCECQVTLTMTCTDFELFKEHYNVKHLKILDGCYFYSDTGMFDEYINKWAEIKMMSKDAIRTIAKLFMNSLYGKLAASNISSYKFAYIDPETDAIRFRVVEAKESQAGYIAIGSAIPSYSRRFTVRAAQANYNHFIYSDTDSIHLNCIAAEVVGAPKDPVKFNHWKYETTWDYGLFVRAKTYIERVIEKDEKPIEEPYYNLKCAGMPERCKNIFIASCTHDKELIKKIKDDPNTTKKELKYIKEGHTFSDFKEGLIIPGSLKAKRITGGTLLINQNYEMHKASYF